MNRFIKLLLAVVLLAPSDLIHVSVRVFEVFNYIITFAANIQFLQEHNV